MNARLDAFSRILFLSLLLSAWAALPSGAAEVVREFPDFVAVVAGEGDTFASLSEKYLKDPSWASFLAEFNGGTPLQPGQSVAIPLGFDRKGGITLRGIQTVPVLSYHNFSPSESSRMTVSRPAFEEQMRLLKDKGYRPIPIDEFFDFLDFKASIPPRSVVITIDDGWRSAYEIAYPILKKYGYPATLFIYTDRISDTAETLSWGLLQEMAENGMEVQCHTKSHRDLVHSQKRESFKDYFGRIGRELAGCKEVVKKKLNREVRYLAYPNGNTNVLVIEMARKLGYRGAFSLKEGSNPFFIHPFRVNRSMIYGDLSLNQFEKNLITREEMFQ